MGLPDTVTKAYMRENTVFADAFNYFLYGGRQVSDIAARHKVDKNKGNPGAKELNIFPVFTERISCSR